jgi:hypothetical protein
MRLCHLAHDSKALLVVISAASREAARIKLLPTLLIVRRIFPKKCPCIGQ